VPELPEVETVCLGIGNRVLHKKINLVVIRNHSLRWPIRQDLPQILLGQVFNKISRRGKYILLKTKIGCLIIHLGMSGSLKINPKEHIFTKHEHVNIVFVDDTALCYTDPRRFGCIIWTEDDPLEHELLKNLGPEPLEAEFTAKYLFDRAQKSKVPIKQFIMNSQIGVEIGNIYASEVLFVAKINPLIPANQIAYDACIFLVKQIKKILADAIKYGGTTIRDYIDSEGNEGTFQNKLKVYGRQGESCLICSDELTQIRIGRRATVFCKHCQKYQK
jgi:formamidopyrimidine-DNA glycosylase